MAERSASRHPLVPAWRVRMNVVAFEKRDGAPRAIKSGALPYAELAVTTNFSFLRGASHPQEYVQQALALGLAGIGIADRNSVAGVVRAYGALRELNEFIEAE